MEKARLRSEVYRKEDLRQKLLSIVHMVESLTQVSGTELSVAYREGSLAAIEAMALAVGIEPDDIMPRRQWVEVPSDRVYRR